MNIFICLFIYVADRIISNSYIVKLFNLHGLILATVFHQPTITFTEISPSSCSSSSSSSSSFSSLLLLLLLLLVLLFFSSSSCILPINAEKEFHFLLQTALSTYTSNFAAYNTHFSHKNVPRSHPAS